MSKKHFKLSTLLSDKITARQKAGLAVFGFLFIVFIGLTTARNISIVPHADETPQVIKNIASVSCDNCQTVTSEADVTVANPNGAGATPTPTPPPPAATPTPTPTPTATPTPPPPAPGGTTVNFTLNFRNLTPPTGPLLVVVVQNGTKVFRSNTVALTNNSATVAIVDPAYNSAVAAEIRVRQGQDKGLDTIPASNSSPITIRMYLDGNPTAVDANPALGDVVEVVKAFKAGADTPLDEVVKRVKTFKDSNP